MQQPEKILKDYSEPEKGAYLGAIASIATADREASPEELEFIRALAASADLSKEQEDAVIRAATEISATELDRCLDILKQSDLRFSLITDIISFAEADGQYSEEEKKNISEIALYLNVNSEQFSLLDQFVKKSAESGKTEEEVAQPGFLESLGLGDKFNSAGINSRSLSGLLGFLGPMILAKMVMGGRQRAGGGLFGNHGRNQRIGRPSSLISLLSGGRGYAGIGGFLQNMAGRRRW